MGVGTVRHGAMLGVRDGTARRDESDGEYADETENASHFALRAKPGSVDPNLSAVARFIDEALSLVRDRFLGTVRLYAERECVQ
jgi:hypothetical protein